MSEVKTVLKSVNVFSIPGGDVITLFPGQQLTVTRYLGNSLVINVGNGFFYLEGNNALAIGCALPVYKTEKLTNVIEIWERLRMVYDPEISINVVDIGLIYEVRWEGDTVDVVMTLTSPTCGMGFLIMSAIEDALVFDNVRHVNVEIKFFPVWNIDMMSEEAKLELGLL